MEPLRLLGKMQFRILLVFFYTFILILGAPAQTTDIKIKNAIDFENRKMYKNAERELTEAILEDPYGDTLFLMRGNVRSKMHRYEEAIDDFREFLKLSPEAYDAFARIARAKAALKDYKGALKDYETALHYDSYNIQFLMERASIYMKLDNSTEAILDYTSVLEISPKTIDALFLRAKARITRMEYSLAVQDLTRILEIDKKNKDALYNRACLMFEMGQKEAACEDWKASMAFGKNESVRWVNQYCKP